MKQIVLLLALIASLSAWAIEQDSEGYYLIGSAADWDEFAEIVLNTNPTVNARMIADIDLGEDQTMIGSTSDSNSALHYQGIFDGQGHTLTVAYVVTGGDLLCAPFTKLNGATVRNIHVKGTMQSAGMHPSCIASDARGTTLIENCWGEVDIISTKSGWIECASIVGCMKAGSCTIKDCLFTGSITASGGYNGCFVGYIDRGTATITNCLSTGDFSGSFAFRGTHNNCYVKQFPVTIPEAMRCTDEQLDDGTITAALQAGRDEVVWVQDVENGMPMLRVFYEPFYRPGDVNHDTRIDIADVADLIDYLLHDVTNAPIESDVNQDDKINISDVTDLIDIILGFN